MGSKCLGRFFVSRTFHLVQTKLLAAGQNFLVSETDSWVGHQKLFWDVSSGTGCHLLFLVEVGASIV